MPSRGTYHPRSKEMGLRIKSLLEKHNHTQGDFQKKVGLPQSSLSLILKGEKGMSNNHLLNICKAYNVSKEWVLCGIDDVGLKLKELDKLIQWKENKHITSRQFTKLRNALFK